jgi:hypothetical protein
MKTKNSSFNPTSEKKIKLFILSRAGHKQTPIYKSDHNDHCLSIVDSTRVGHTTISTNSVDTDKEKTPHQNSSQGREEKKRGES